MCGVAGLGLRTQEEKVGAAGCGAILKDEMNPKRV